MKKIKLSIAALLLGVTGYGQCVDTCDYSKEDSLKAEHYGWNLPCGHLSEKIRIGIENGDIVKMKIKRKEDEEN